MWNNRTLRPASGLEQTPVPIDELQKVALV